MAGVVDDEDGRQSKSKFACQICRRRKVKCGRELPGCLLCEQNAQPCTYPVRVSKPGPKIGSTRAPRKRSHGHIEDHEQEDVETQSGAECSGASCPVPTASHIPPAETDSRLTLPVDQAADIQSLSFIIHPSHEFRSPDLQHASPPSAQGTDRARARLESSCQSLGITYDQTELLIEMFRDSFHSFQLFREPRLSTLQHVKSTCQMQGLLCAIIAFALKHSNEQSPSAFSQTKGPAYSFGHLSSSGFMALASKYLDQGIDECGDEPLPLVLLQTLILVTHWFLIEGVRGRAWRYLGICVSSAYELNLHLVDSKHSPSNADVSDVRLWCEKEERRRAWWAIWEMDVFASVIRRCPTIINWSQNETWLPVDDEKWFRGEFQQSCLLEVKPGLRWKTLQATGNRSPKAWFIVINALMKDAQVISSPVGVGRPLFDPLSSDSHHGLGAAERDEIRVGLKGLWIVQNSLKSAVMAMPSSARYQHQYLYFGARETDRRVAADQRGLHSSIYGIHLMIQLTKLMIYRYYIFRIGLKWPNLSRTSSAGHRKPDDALLFEKLPDARIPSMAEFQAFEQYFEAADEVIILVRRSHIDQFRYVNPFLANTVWLACAVQLFHRDFATAGNSDYDLVNSSFDLLRLTYDKFSEHWNMSTALQRNLQALEEEFRYVRGGSSASRGGTHDGVSPKLDSLQAHRSNMPAPQGTRESTVSHGESNMPDSRLNGPTRTANNLEPEESNGPALAGRQSSHFALLSSDVEETVANEPDVPPSRSQTQRPIDWSNSARPETAWPGQLGGASDLGDFPAPFENLFNGMRWDSSLAYLSNESVRTDMSSGFWDFIPFPDTAIPRDGPSAGTNPI